MVTLSPSSLGLLKSVGALDLMNHHYITPFTDMLVNEEHGHSYIKFSNDVTDKCLIAKAQDDLFKKYVKNDHSSYNALGASVENDHMVAALFESIEEQGKTELLL